MNKKARAKLTAVTHRLMLGICFSCEVIGGGVGGIGDGEREE